MTMVPLCQLPLGGVAIWKDEGVYNGVVAGVYMHGMVVDLDEKVWLLVTNTKIAPPHSVRVGAIKVRACQGGSSSLSQYLQNFDDGSSLSCCWANAGAAERLLRLHETTQRAFFHSRRSSKKTETKRSRDTVGYHLEKMLKKHHRVIVKNNRVSPDLSTLGFTFIVDSEEVFSCSDERLLRLNMLNASVGSAFSLDAEPKELHAARQPVRNVWITEVGCLNPLNEASNIIHDLSS